MSVIEYDFGKGKRQATRRFRELLSLDALHEANVRANPLPYLERASERIYQLEKALFEAVQTGKPQPGDPVSTETVQVDKAEYQRLLACHAIVEDALAKLRPDEENGIVPPIGRWSQSSFMETRFGSRASAVGQSPLRLPKPDARLPKPGLRRSLVRTSNLGSEPASTVACPKQIWPLARASSGRTHGAWDAGEAPGRRSEPFWRAPGGQSQTWGDAAERHPASAARTHRLAHASLLMQEGTGPAHLGPLVYR